MVKVFSGKPNWPLLTLAALSFIPGFGFLIGAAAITWALISSRSRARLALIIAATGLAGNIALGVFVYRFAMTDPAMVEARRELVAVQLALVVEGLEAHRAQHGAYPKELTELTASSGIRNILDVSAGVSASRKPYQYMLMPDGEHYGVFAVGADGEPWTADDIDPKLDDSLQARTGWVKVFQETRELPPADAP